MFAGGWINHFAEERSQARVRALLVRTHQARVAGHIGGENGGQTTGCGHGNEG